MLLSSRILTLIPQIEFQTWGHFNVGVYQGPNREKALDRIKDGLDSILIVGKSLFIRAGDYDQIATVEWSLVIVDEFHEFKNGKSQGYMRLADLRDNSGCPVIGMTGTLMQNNHDELYYLIDLVRPGLLGDIKEFKNEISKPIMYARAKDTKEEVLKLSERQGEFLRGIINPAYLERKKEDVLRDSLTEKREKVVFCELSDLQKRMYRHILSLPDFWLLRMANAPCDCGVNKQYFRGYKKMRTHKEQINYQRRHKKELIPKKKCCYKYPFNPRRAEPGEPQIDPGAVLWISSHEKAIGNPDDIDEDVLDDKYICCQVRFEVSLALHYFSQPDSAFSALKNCPMCITFAAMNKLYKISSHPSLLQVDRCESGPEAKKKLEFARVALTPDMLRELPGGTVWKSDGIMDDHVTLSGKMKSLDYLLRRYLRRQNRILVFSHSTASLDLIQNHIRTQGWTNIRLDGQTPTSQRQSLVNQFQKGDIEIFLISTKAGGLGLNLTRANKVILFDVNWNPSYDEQAQDRAYRIGQKRNVDTVRLVARGTIEELIYARQVYKVQLKKQTLGHNTDGKNQPQIFRGVAQDKNRKGELFGLENLLRYRDGSFMASLWKKADDPKEEHDMNDLASEFNNLDEEKLDSIAEEGDEGPKDSPKALHNTSDDDDSLDRVDHGDYFNDGKGKVGIARGEEGFDEEMGAVSQVVEFVTKMECDKLSDHESDHESDAGNDEVLEEIAEQDEAEEVDEIISSASSELSRLPSAKHSGNNEGPVDRSRNNSEGIDATGGSPVRNSEEETFEGPRTQPTQLKTQPTQQPSPAQQGPKRNTTAKVSIMGSIFENKKNSAGKKSAIYVPKYSR
ncbi:hypothetical protein ACHAWF_017268 [Thalassiosira exigua]